MEGAASSTSSTCRRLFGMHVTDGQQAVAVGLEGHIARTTDGGARWTFDKIDAGDVPLVDPIYDVVRAPGRHGMGASARPARSSARRRRDAAWTRAKIGQDVLTWLRAHQLLRSAARLDGRRLRAHLPDDGRRQDLAAVAGLSDARRRHP